MIRKRGVAVSLWTLAAALPPLCLAAPVALAQQAAAEGAGDGGGGPLLDEIVVTAQRRAQSAQDVPIAMSVVTADRIEAVTAQDMGDLAAYVPGLNVSGSPTQPTYAIRGVQTSDFGVGTDPAVGVYVDGIYSGRSGAALLAFNDVERIEVLKGPQGTLFGRNSAAGAVSIITRKPTDEVEAEATLRLGEFDKRRVEAMANVPVTEGVALRVNALWNKRDGWVKDAATGQDYAQEDNWAARAALRWDMAGDAQAILSWDHDDIEQDARPAFGIVAVPAAPGRPAFPPDPSAYVDPRGRRILNDAVDNHESRNLDSVTLTLTKGLGSVDLTSLTNYRAFQNENREDEDGTNRRDLYFDTNNREKNESFYQEIRLAGTTGNADWIAGVSYAHEDVRQVSDTFLYTDTVNTVLGNLGLGTPFSDLDNFVLGPFGIPFRLLGNGWREAMVNDGNFDAYAAFGDVIFHVTDRLNVTVGARMTFDEKEFGWFNTGREAPELDQYIATLDQLGVLAAAGVPPEALMFDLVFDVGALEGTRVSRRKSWNDFSPRLVADYELADGVMTYASYAKGYKAGGFNSVEVLSRFDNEEVHNFEGGFKTSFPQQGLSLNASLFHYVYKDKQRIRLVQETAGSTVPQYLVETSDDEATGVDFDAYWRPVEPLELLLAASYIDATIKDRVTRDGIDLAGQPTGEPHWTLTAGATYTAELGAGGTVKASLQHAYRGRQRCNEESVLQGNCAVGAPFKVGGARNRTDARVGWTSADGHYEVAAFATNLFDNQYVTGINSITALTLGTPFAAVTEPRMVGVDLTFRY